MKQSNSEKDHDIQFNFFFFLHSIFPTKHIIFTWMKIRQKTETVTLGDLPRRHATLFFHSKTIFLSV